MRKYNMLRRGAVVLLSAAMVIGLLPVSNGGQTAKAEPGDKRIAGLGTSVICEPENPSTGNAWKGSYVYYGTYDGEAVRYRVLDSDSEDFGAETLLLDCDSTLKLIQYSDNTLWTESLVRKYLNSEGPYASDGFLTSAFTQQERSAIADSTKGSVAAEDGSGFGSYAFCSLNGEKVFLLDAKEATRESYGYSNTFYAAANRSKASGEASGNSNWWLRTAIYDSNGYSAMKVQSNGTISTAGTTVANSCVSPACNLKQSLILFTSLVSGTAGEVGAEYKLTLLDKDIGIRQNGDIIRKGANVTIPYIISGNNSGNVTQVSVLLLSKEYQEENATILAYEKLEMDSFALTGKGSFTLPSDLADKSCGSDYYAYLVAEDVNGEKVTDYAGTPVKLDDIPNVSTAEKLMLQLDVPKSGNPLPKTAELETDIGGASLSLVWKQDGNRVSGNARYGTVYTTDIVIDSDIVGGKLASNVTITVNGSPVSAENIKYNQDGSITIRLTYTTQKAKLLRVMSPQAITDVPNGTPKTAEALGLPSILTIETEDASVTAAEVTWDLENLVSGSYASAVRARQVFVVKGIVKLPAGIVNTDNISLEVKVQVTVNAADVSTATADTEDTTADTADTTAGTADTTAGTEDTTADTAADTTARTTAVPATGDAVPLKGVLLLAGISGTGFALTVGGRRRKER